MPSAREASIEAMANAIASCPIYRDYDAYRPTDYRKLATWALDAISVPSEERCTECEGTGHERRSTVDMVARVYQPCAACSGSGKRSSAPLIVGTLIEAGVLEDVTQRFQRICDNLALQAGRGAFAITAEGRGGRLFRISPSSTSEETE